MKSLPNNKKRPVCRQAGFTLIELLVVVAVVGILAAAVVSGINPTARFADARDAQRKQIAQSIAQAIEACFSKLGSYTGCTDLATLNTSGYLRFNYSGTYDVDSDANTIPVGGAGQDASVFMTGTGTVGTTTVACASTQLENSLTEGTGTDPCASGCKYWKYVSSKGKLGYSTSNATTCNESDVLFK